MAARTVKRNVKGDTMDVRHWPALLIVGAIIAGGCGDDDGSVDDSDEATTPAPSTSVALTAASSAPDSVSGSSQPAAALFEDSFDDDRNGWGIVDDPQYGSTAFEGGDYVWEFKGSVAHWLPAVLGEQYDRGELDMLDVVVRAEATVLAGGGVIGVFCRETPDVDAEWQWYEFVARDGYAAIRHADLEGNLETLTETQDVTLTVGEPIAIEATCVDNPDGHAELSLTLNGEQVLTATDDEPLGNGVSGLQAWTFPLHAQMDIRWHDFSIHAAGN
jgi:hypothetical protein